MSITRSTSQQEPVTNFTDWSGHGLLLIGHGSERSSGPNLQLLAQADTLRARGIFASVEAAVLYGEPGLAGALHKLSPLPVLTLPMFMCEGLFTKKIIPEQIVTACAENDSSGEITSCSPVGLSEGLANLIANRVSAKVEKNGEKDHEVSVILVGHGSTASDASWQATERHAARLRDMGQYREVQTAYLDQHPLFDDVLSGQSGQVYVVGLFAAAGLHAADDIPMKIASSPVAQNISYLGAIGSDRGMIDLALRQINSL